MVFRTCALLAFLGGLLTYLCVSPSVGMRNTRMDDPDEVLQLLTPTLQDNFHTVTPFAFKVKLPSSIDFPRQSEAVAADTIV